MLDRLSDFDGTCLTLLVRGLVPPPSIIEKAFSRLPSERFVVKNLPPYNPSFGFVADQLMLSWAVKSAGATAFISTLYTQPLWVCITQITSNVGFKHVGSVVTSALGTARSILNVLFALGR